MQPAFSEVKYDFWVVALPYLIATFSSYVGLDLHKRIRGNDRTTMLAWLLGGSMALGTGIWSMHFVGMLAMSLPFDVGYDYILIALSWLSAVIVSTIAIYAGSRPNASLGHIGLSSIAIGAGLCGMHYLGMSSMQVTPAVQWNWLWVCVSGGMSVGVSALALLIVFRLREATEKYALAVQVGGALLIAAGLVGMQYVGMMAVSYSNDSLSLSADQLRGNMLGLLITIASIFLLSVTAFTSALDSRFNGKAERLTRHLKAANLELQRIAFRDPLTKLPNRLLFDDRVRKACERSVQTGNGLALLFVDLDGFKSVNDSLGHLAGDAVLREMGGRLQKLMTVTDTVARIGGDEFVILLERISDTSLIGEKAQNIIEAICRPIVLDNQQVDLSCSIGVAVFPADGPQDQLIAHADAAMYSAKRTGGSNFAFFEPHMNAGVKEQIEIQRDLRRAIEDGELELFYQPKVNAKRLVITGVEALIRWRHPTRGILSPGLFIPIAERFGLIGAIGNWVIEEACRQSAIWLRQGLRFRVAINLSVHQLRQDDLSARVDAAIKKHRINPNLITFEITESMTMENGEGTFESFEKLTRLGVNLSIDDFGTGYSSLSYLRRLRVGELKIDRSFVLDIANSADARTIVEAIIQLAHALGLKVVAEGVETEAQRDVLLGLKCDDLQGFLFAMPMNSTRMTEWAEANDNGPLAKLSFAPSTFLEEEWSHSK